MTTLTTRQLVKGQRVQLRNGWFATMVTVRGDTPMATVEGIYTETGSVYAHDIARAATVQTKLDDGSMLFGGWVTIEHTPKQLKLRATVAAMGM